MTNFRTPPLRDAKYLKAYNGQTCIVCESDQGVVGAHIRTGHEGSMGKKPGDDLTLPLCFRHHMAQEDSPGPRWWESNIFEGDMSIDDIKAMARRLYATWKTGSTGTTP